MNFLMETTDMDLGDTPIENIFINDFMPMANGTYVKVYLLGYKYAYDRDPNIEVNNNTIAKHLNIPLVDVLSAWDFWEGKGIVEKIPNNPQDKYDYRIRFFNLKQLYIKNNYQMLEYREGAKKKEYKSSVKDLIGANQIPEINKMFNSIDYTIRRQLVPNEKKKILEWIHNYNMNPDIIERAFFYGVEKKGIRNINYVGGIVRNWYDQGITNVAALQEHLKENNERYYNYEKIIKSLGYGGRMASEGERKVIDKWFDDYKFPMEMILKACENSKRTANPSINYIDGILTSWYQKGIKTEKDVETKDSPPERKAYRPSSGNVASAKQTRFHNFEQRTSAMSAEEIEAIARRKREEYYSKAKGENNDV